MTMIDKTKEQERICVAFAANTRLLGCIDATNICAYGSMLATVVGAVTEIYVDKLHNPDILVAAAVAGVAGGVCKVCCRFFHQSLDKENDNLVMSMKATYPAALAAGPR